MHIISKTTRITPACTHGEKLRTKIPPKTTTSGAIGELKDKRLGYKVLKLCPDLADVV